MDRSIKIIKLKKEAIHDYRLVIIFSTSESFEINIDLGLKTWQTQPAMNIPATGNLSPRKAEILAHAIAIGNQLIRGELCIEQEDYRFRPVYR